MPNNESPELKKALDEGSGGELPPNSPRGILGDRGLNVSKTDDPNAHGLSAGLSDEWDGPVVWLLVILLYLLFFPLAFVVLWRSRVLPRRTKIGMTVLMVAGIIAAVTWFLLGAGRGA
jgi:hypothetical protein